MQRLLPPFTLMYFIRLAFLLLLCFAPPVLSVSNYPPGVPPQCLDSYECDFFRNISGTLYSYSLSPLCRAASFEYAISKRGNVAGSYPLIRFNLCGTLSTSALAPLNDALTAQRLPLPRSHGVAIQYIEDPATPLLNPNNIKTADIDTCDQGTNPSCIQGSENYPTVPNGGATTSNTERVLTCAATPSLPYCRVSPTNATSAMSEIIAIYDGTEGAFDLLNATNATGGIQLTYAGGFVYLGDTYPCLGIDPTTGVPPLREFSVTIQCDPSVPDLIIEEYEELSVCTYSVRAKSSLACGVKLTASSSASPSRTSSQTVTPTASSSPSASPSRTSSQTPTASSSPSQTMSQTTTLSPSPTPSSTIAPPTLFSVGALTGTAVGCLAAGALSAWFFITFAPKSSGGAGIGKMNLGEGTPLSYAYRESAYTFVK
jgi:hypothetical protein